MDFLFIDTDYIDFMESCAAILIILIIRVKYINHPCFCENQNLCDNQCNLWLYSLFIIVH